MKKTDKVQIVMYTIAIIIGFVWLFFVVQDARTKSEFIHSYFDSSTTATHVSCTCGREFIYSDLGFSTYCPDCGTDLTILKVFEKETRCGDCGSTFIVNDADYCTRCGSANLIRDVVSYNDIKNYKPYTTIFAILTGLSFIICGFTDRAKSH